MPFSVKRKKVITANILDYAVDIEELKQKPQKEIIKAIKGKHFYGATLNVNGETQRVVLLAKNISTLNKGLTRNITLVDDIKPWPMLELKMFNYVNNDLEI